jgi:hypothetical protein
MGERNPAMLDVSGTEHTAWVCKQGKRASALGREAADIARVLEDLAAPGGSQAAVDRNGYSPTHNRHLPKPHSGAPHWNVLDCRNRRCYEDRASQASARNRKRFLLNTYWRDMGGGEPILVSDPLSSHCSIGVPLGRTSPGIPIPLIWRN